MESKEITSNTINKLNPLEELYGENLTATLLLVLNSIIVTIMLQSLTNSMGMLHNIVSNSNPFNAILSLSITFLPIWSLIHLLSKQSPTNAIFYSLLIISICIVSITA